MLDFLSIRKNDRATTRTGLLVVILLLLLFLPAPSQLHAQDFQPKRIENPLVTPLYIDDIYRGDIALFLSTDGTVFWVEKDEFVSHIEGMVKEELIDSLRMYNEGYITLQWLRDVSFDITFDTKKVRIMLNILPEQKKLQTREIVREKKLRPVDTIETPILSGYLNVLPSLTVMMVSGDTEPTFSLPFSGNVEVGINFSSLVAETNLHFSSTGNVPVSVKSSKLTAVLEAPRHFLYLGDAPYTVGRFQKYRSIYGMIMEKTKQRISRGVSKIGIEDVDLFLANPSVVTVLINGNIYRRYSLEAGPYSIRNFPLSQGVNELELRIEDRITGETRTEVCTVPFTPQLMEPSDFAYSLAFGVVQKSVEDKAPEPFLSGVFSYGFSPVFSASMGIQSNFSEALGTLELVWGTPIGIVAGNVGVSFGNNTTAFTCQGQYNYNELVSLAFSFASKAYNPFARQTTASGRPNFSISLGNSFQVESLFSLRSYLTIGRDDLSLQLNLNAPVQDTARLTLSVEPTFTYRSKVISLSGSILFTVTEYSRDVNRSSSSTSVRHDPKEGSTSVSWQSINDRVIRQPIFSASYFNADQGPVKDSSFQGAMRYQDYRFEGSTSVSYSDKSNTQQSSIHINLATSIAFAGPHVTISRPQRGSFVLVEAEQSLREGTIGLNPSGGAYESLVSVLPGTISNLRAFTPTHINVSAPELTLEQELKKDSYYINPGFKRGYYIFLEEDRRFYAGAVLIAAGEEKPIPLVAGELRNSTTGEIRQFFSDREGNIVFNNIEPGAYTLSLYKKGWEETQITIPTTSEQYVDLGEIPVNKGGNRK